MRSGALETRGDPAALPQFPTVPLRKAQPSASSTSQQRMTTAWAAVLPLSLRRRSPWGVSQPASSGHFVAVGGTTLFVDVTSEYKVRSRFIRSADDIWARFPKPDSESEPQIALEKSSRNLPGYHVRSDPGTGVAVYWQGTIAGTVRRMALAARICAR